MRDTPLVSILINNYNYGHFLKAAIDSALDQTYPYTEVIVVDDGSTDNSRAVLERYGNRIIPIFKANGGQGSALNAGFGRSRGKLICLLDADDVFSAQKVARVVETMRANPGSGWCFHRLARCDTRTGLSLPSDPLEQPSRAIDFRADLRRAVLPSFAPATSGLSFTRELLLQIWPMPELGGTSADRFTKFAALGLATGSFLNENLAEQKVHGYNAYTLQGTSRQWVAAKSLLHTATWLKERFVQFIPMADALFGIGLGLYERNGGVDPQYMPLVERYLQDAGPIRALAIQGRAFYHAQELFAPLREVRLAQFQARARQAKAPLAASNAS
ncbi:glycosyltransferase family 2 protein [Anthocerotibacter panamensis]|uniref:glycosyltransferase family 2 protein n=1 Tax=Anthocerotibacter panamensis TaxID=2857077 RepID=UPI001C405421|nr:glycosyltransferase family A protein [Anthocerotibacter panamensis]